MDRISAFMNTGLVFLVIGFVLIFVGMFLALKRGM